VLYYTDFSARTISTYNVATETFDRLKAACSEGTGKAICACHDELYVITPAQITKVDTVTNEITKAVDVSLNL
jgi:hypothetical protein